jgi:hypothetical protein
MIRAVVVRPDDEQADRWVRQCVAYVERHGQTLVAIADSAGAMAMVAAGGADLVVAARDSHVERPPFVRVVADESRDPAAGPRDRRARRTRLTH